MNEFNKNKMKILNKISIKCNKTYCLFIRQCRLHNIPAAFNRHSADLMITSTLWDDDDYEPTKPLYVEYKR